MIDGVVVAKSDYTEEDGYMGWLLVIHVSGGIFTLYRGESLVTGPQPAADEWTHVVVTFEDGFLTLYVNGLSAGTAESTEDVVDTRGPVQIGGGAQWNELAATIDEVALYEHALTPDRVRAPAVVRDARRYEAATRADRGYSRGARCAARRRGRIRRSGRHT